MLQNSPRTSNPRKIYIAGPMKGYINFNFPFFFEVEKHLISLGFEVVNPAKLDGDGDITSLSRHSRKDIMRRDFKELLSCDAICLLPDWVHSIGANLERQVAQCCGIEIWYWEDLKRLNK